MLNFPISPLQEKCILIFWNLLNFLISLLQEVCINLWKKGWNLLNFPISLLQEVCINLMQLSIYNGEKPILICWYLLYFPISLLSTRGLYRLNATTNIQWKNKSILICWNLFDFTILLLQEVCINLWKKWVNIRKRARCVST